MAETESASDVEQMVGELGEFPELVAKPFVIGVSRLPGTRKSYFCRQLVRRLPTVLLESDRLRKALFPLPSYSAAESRRLFRACHLLMERFLGRGIPRIFDATNLSEYKREYVYRVASRMGAKPLLLLVEVPSELVCVRPKERRLGSEGNSDANWQVYQRVKPQSQRIRRCHYAVDTSRDITSVIDKIVREVSR